MTIADLRKQYSQKSLNEKDVAADPIIQFGEWWNEAVAADIEEVNAMTLATASLDGIPAARIVLLKGYNPDGFIFFTNYESYKGKQLEENPKACLVFFWKELERQVRITGLVSRLSSKENDEYFYSRPLASQIGAAVSPQSQVINNRQWLDEQFSVKEKLLAHEKLTRPSHWGGYIVKPVIVEYWQGRPDRLHDRIQYSFEEGEWKRERLAP